MKRKINFRILISIIILVIALPFASLADEEFNFSGYVRNLQGMMPIPNQPVFISINDTSDFYTLTDSNGYYNETISFDDDVEVDIAIVGVYDCNDEFDFKVFESPEEENVADFNICYSNNQCEAHFGFYPDFDNDMLIYFVNNSIGSYSETSWDFGDGSFSNEENPQHEYSEMGVYQVSLTISDSLNGCFSTFTDEVILMDSSECVADFSYMINPINNLEVSFLDLSFGELDYWNWNFGDSSTSGDRFPVHTYDNSGLYNVCLTVGNYDDNCVDSLCVEIFVGDSIRCEADFDVVLDTLNNTPNTFIFSDLSLGNIQNWLWDFGDGNTSIDQNPVHTYSNEGSYEVCLYVSSTPSGMMCSDFICKTVETMQYFNFGGHAFIDGFPINIEETDSANFATAYLYRRFNNQWKYMDERNFWKFGYYWFANKPYGEYLIRIDLDGGSEQYGKFAPAYYKNSIDWRFSTTFNLINNNQYAVDVNLRKLYQLESGSGSISGKLENDLSCEEQIPPKQLIKLFKDNNYVDYSYTNNQNEFEFNSLSMGNYKIQAELPGKVSSIEFVELTNSNSISDGHILSLNCNAWVGIEENNLISNGEITSVFPVPATNFINFDLQTDIGKQINVQLFDVLGKKLFEKSFISNSLITNLKINLSNYNQGLIIYRFSDETGRLIGSGKIIHN